MSKPLQPNDPGQPQVRGVQGAFGGGVKGSGLWGLRMEWAEEGVGFGV